MADIEYTPLGRECKSGGRIKMKNVTLCYLENEKGEYLMLHRVKKQNDLNHDKWIGVGG